MNLYLRPPVATARKVRRLHNDRVLAGFAGATADAFTLFERFEAKLDKHQGQLARAAVELAKDWRTDRALRRLEALLLVADTRITFLLSGTGDLIEPDDEVVVDPQAVDATRLGEQGKVALLQTPDKMFRSSLLAMSVDVATGSIRWQWERMQASATPGE